MYRFARTLGGQEVFIRLIKKGNDGGDHLEILIDVATGHAAMLGENHSLPMLRELQLEDMTFGVFPSGSDRPFSPWFDNVGEAFDAIIQIMQPCPI